MLWNWMLLKEDVMRYKKNKKNTGNLDKQEKPGIIYIDTGQTTTQRRKHYGE